jgi:hypothetical protein
MQNTLTISEVRQMFWIITDITDFVGRAYQINDFFVRVIYIPYNIYNVSIEVNIVVAKLFYLSFAIGI